MLTPQIREKFDSGEDVELTDNINPHDVACLLKEFFRSLPEPLLTRDLYQPFLTTQSESERERERERERELVNMCNNNKYVCMYIICMYVCACVFDFLLVGCFRWVSSH